MSYIISEKIRKIIVLCVLVLSIFLILFHYTDTPKVWVDEGVFTQTARNFAMHGVLGLQTDPGNFFLMQGTLLSTNYPVVFPVAGSLALFGTGVWQARLPMVIYMFILVLLFYFFTKKRYGFYPAILSVLMLVSFAPFYGDGRPVLGEVPGLVFLVLGSFLLLYWEESNFQNRKWAIFSGVAFGLAAATKPIYFLVLSIALFITLVIWFRTTKDKEGLSIFCLGFIIPILIWFFINFPNIGLLLKIIPSYLHLAGNHGSSTPIITTIINNFLRFFTESTPILFSFLLGSILLSFLFQFKKIKNHGFSISEYIILLFVGLNWVTYLGGTGWYRYFFPAHILLYLLFPAAFLVLVNYFNKEIIRKILFMVPIALIVFQFYHLVFLSDTSLVVDRTRNNELSSVLSKINPNQRILFYNVPETVIFLKDNNYSQYLSMEDFLVTGNNSILNSYPYDYVLTGDDAESLTLSLPDYNKQKIDRYVLFTKIK